MKKFVSLLIILAILLSLGACSSSPDKETIEIELQGYWYVKGQYFERYYHFADGKYESVLSKKAGDTYYSGTYEIRDDSIEIRQDGISESGFFPYTYNKDNGKFRLFWDDDKTMEMIKGE